MEPHTSSSTNHPQEPEEEQLSTHPTSMGGSLAESLKEHLGGLAKRDTSSKMIEDMLAELAEPKPRQPRDCCT
ncbi:MAG TPA: hypothetical protein VGH44_03170 [Candidatus Saccharimonadia bacterium]|jgi:hypothetical protein